MRAYLVVEEYGIGQDRGYRPISIHRSERLAKHFASTMSAAQKEREYQVWNIIADDFDDRD